MLCSTGNACSPTVLGWWCLFLPYKSLVSWDAWLGLVESTGSRAPLRVCSEGFAARMPSHSLLLPSSSSRVLRGVSVSKVAPHLSSLFLASEAALGTKFTTFSWFPEQIKALHWPDTAFNRGAATHCSKISRTAALAVRRKMFNQGTKMFVWETGAVQSPSYLQYLTMMAPEQLSLEHSRGMRWNWTGMAEADRATPSLGNGEQDRSQAEAGEWIKSPMLNPSTARKPPLTLLPKSLCYDNWAFLMPHCQRNTQLFLEQMVLQQLFLGFYKKKKIRNKSNRYWWILLHFFFLFFC